MHARGDCLRLPQYMAQNCKKSCDLCGPGKETFVFCEKLKTNHTHDASPDVCYKDTYRNYCLICQSRVLENKRERYVLSGLCKLHKRTINCCLPIINTLCVWATGSYKQPIIIWLKIGTQWVHVSTATRE